MCCVLENTDWVAWSVRFDPVVMERLNTFDSSCQHKEESVVSLYI